MLNIRNLIVCVTIMLLTCAVAASQADAQAVSPTDPGWPRTFSKGGTTVTLYQPQIDAWPNRETLRFRCAVEVQLDGSSQPQYGVVAVEANTDVDDGNTTVYMTQIQVKSINFPGVDPTDAAALKAVVTELLPSMPSLNIALPRVLAYMHDSPKPKGVDINLNPPPIYYSATPAILLGFIGQPQFKPVDGAKVMMAVNTNWTVLMDEASATYYLLDGSSWLQTSDPMKGPWTAAGALPASFNDLPKGDEWDDVRKATPGAPWKGTPPTVYATTTPSELIVTDGSVDLTPIIGTSLMYVSNPVQPVFYSLMNSQYYFLAAGRWFSAPSLNGPWAAASANLPSDFSKIPPDSPVGFVLVSVPNTPQAEDAVLLSEIPHKSTINIKDVNIKVVYEGQPTFVPIEGTTMKYATNTGYQVIYADNQYYCCSNGVWFVSPGAVGPWAVCTSVPTVIYTIPPSCPVYNCTYVKVYSSTPSTVVVGYTSGYSGAYVAATGALMFGVGMAVGAAIEHNSSCCWYGYHPCYYSYGCGAYCHYGYGGCGWYGGGYAHYGPYGGSSYAAGYNPYTGTYGRTASAYGPYGSAHASQVYNPWTGNYGAHASASNGYGSWGGTTVSNGDKWAQGEHYTNNATGVTHGWAENSSGQSMNYAHKGNSSVGEGSNGDIYASHDGNVYKKGPNGNWNTYQNGSWQQTQWQKGDGAQQAQNDWKSSGQSMQNSWNNSSHSSWDSASANRDSWSRDYSNSHSSWGGGDSWGNRSGGGGWGGGGRSWGGGGGFRGFRR